MNNFSVYRVSPLRNVPGDQTLAGFSHFWLCRERNQAVQLISSAKVLQRSSYVEVCENVYINPYMTHPEDAAAYRMREQRRLSRQRRANQSVGVSGDNGLTVQTHENGSTMCLPDGVLPQHTIAIE
jgi:hypothetical protein